VAWRVISGIIFRWIWVVSLTVGRLLKEREEDCNRLAGEESMDVGSTGHREEDTEYLYLSSLVYMINSEKPNEEVTVTSSSPPLNAEDPLRTDITSALVTLFQMAVIVVLASKFVVKLIEPELLARFGRETVILSLFCRVQPTVKTNFKLETTVTPLTVADDTERLEGVREPT
jgi:hypothetical protein